MFSFAEFGGAPTKALRLAWRRVCFFSHRAVRSDEVLTSISDDWVGRSLGHLGVLEQLCVSEMIGV